MDELTWRVRDAICRRDNDCGDDTEIAKIMNDFGDYYEALARAAVEEMQRTDAPPVNPALLTQKSA